MSRSHPIYCSHGKCLTPGDECFGLTAEKCPECEEHWDRTDPIRIRDKEIERLLSEVSYLQFDKAHLLCAMNSIARSTCCDKCNEAKMVAVKCIDDLGKLDTVSTRQEKT